MLLTVIFIYFLFIIHSMKGHNLFLYYLLRIVIHVVVIEITIAPVHIKLVVRVIVIRRSQPLPSTRPYFFKHQQTKSLLGVINIFLFNLHKSNSYSLTSEDKYLLLNTDVGIQTNGRTAHELRFT